MNEKIITREMEDCKRFLKFFIPTRVAGGDKVFTRVKNQLQAVFNKIPTPPKAGPEFTSGVAGFAVGILLHCTTAPPKAGQ